MKERKEELQRGAVKSEVPDLGGLSLVARPMPTFRHALMCGCGVQGTTRVPGVEVPVSCATLTSVSGRGFPEVSSADFVALHPATEQCLKNLYPEAHISHETLHFYKGKEAEADGLKQGNWVFRATPRDASISSQLPCRVRVWG